MTTWTALRGTNCPTFVMLEDSTPVVLVCRKGEDHELFRQAFLKGCKACDTTLVGIIEFEGLPPRREFMPEPVVTEAPTRLHLLGLD
jgi:hypothetical protein